MNFSAWAIRNPVAPLLAFALLLIMGWQSFTGLPITQFPTIDVPVVSVSVSQPGAAPAELETQVTREVENAVAGIAGVKNVTSTVTDGMSSTVVEFRMEVPTDQAVQDVKDQIDQIRGSLPAGVDEPRVTRVNVEGGAIMTFAVSAPAMTFEELSWFVDDTITGDLQGLSGVGRVDRYGGADREILITLDPSRLDAYGITAAQVSQQISLTNSNQGAGRADLGAGEQAIRVLGDQGDAERLASTTISLPTGQQVRLDSLGTVSDSFEELRSFTKVNGQDVVTFAIFRAKGASEVSVSEVVNHQLDEIRAENPGVDIRLIDDTVFYTEGNYEAAIHTLIEGSILAVLVVLLFLRNWRATFIAAVALPLSAIPTFWAMDLLGFSLNLISFLAITLATGILVDDAIVEIENIQRHIRMGKSPYRAAIDAADEIGLAVIATTFTIIAVFVPVSFMPGIPGQYFRQFGLTVAIAVLFSLLVARLITPLMAAYMMRAKDGGNHDHKDGALMRGYLRFVRATSGGRFLFIPARYLTLLTAFGVLIVSVYFMVQVPGSLFPEEDASRFQVSVELPPGSRLEDTEATTDAITTAISNVDGVKDVFVLGGASPRGGLDIRRASVTVILDRLDNSLERKLLDIVERVPVVGEMVPDVPPHGRIRPQWEIEEEVIGLIAPIPDIRAYRLAAGPGGGNRDITYSILSDDPVALNEAVRRLEEALSGEPLLEGVSAEGALPRPELQVTPRSEEAARLGVTTAAIAQTVRVATIGDFDDALAKVSIDNRLIPVRVELTGQTREDLARIGALRVPTARGGSVPLNAVADIRISEGPSAIDRLNRERIATLGANLPSGVPLGTATARFNEIVAGVDLPEGVRVAESGDAEVQQELVGSFVNAMVLGLLLVLTVLILLFRSVIQPFTILFSLPLAIGGVAAALILTRNPVSMPVMIGILMLMGIVTKNAILLVDFAIEMMAKGMNRFEAVVEAGHKRAQPIVMTSIAMSAGMLPSALGVGEGGSFRAPMATAVIGGIIVSTVLSLVIVPSFFLIMDDLQRAVSWVFGRFIGTKDEEPEAPDARELASGLAARRAEIAALEARLLRIEGDKTRPVLHVAE
ncbi:MAG: RND efflux system, inner membrane transporter [uncultured Rubellimicrobium sp.]|uniref:RND efflux system, inner membrane transporter n=1 Tax=uncultured Rubellimicrobium sp. TaxID=543078 RepID=A0A6J4NMD7_9RHOB|nr:MAG: RND efflux system, inner membrane transporter [uncultured Rubellimicrobium sp.]